jgi:hypothetical protein
MLVPEGTPPVTVLVNNPVVPLMQEEVDEELVLRQS